MKLDETQKQKIRTWLDQGIKLGEIQNRIGTEFGLKMTYMEVRFLLDDLKLQPKDPEPPKAPAAELPAKPADGASPTELVDEAPLASKVSVTVDQLARPGTMVSGKVTFSDGKSADWYLDQTGRLGVAPQEKGYKPSQEDVMAFQTELQNEMAKMGF